MACPTRQELEAIFAPGPARDAARATAILAHARECPRCRALLRADELEPAPPAAARDRTRRAPPLPLILFGALGVALIALSRSCARPRHAGAAAPVTTATR